jgi:glycogen(starch) synthase
MNILLVSYAYAPSVGGIETVGGILHDQFVHAGHTVIVVTWSSGGPGTPTLVRRPGRWALLKLTRWADVVMHNNICLTAFWPLLFLRRPWVVAHHTWLSRTDGRRGLRDRLKLRLLGRAVNISISTAMAEHIGVPSTVIPNPYRDEVFTTLPGIPRDRDIVILGRLVSDKGVDVLIAALARLAAQGVRPSCTVIGSGPDEDALRAQVVHAGLDGQVSFAGTLRGAELVALLNRHRIIAVPSRWREPFGVVALEGIACGCVAVVSADGGLPDAAGPCGITAANGDPVSLADRLAELLVDAARIAALRERATAHLENHRSAVVARRYLSVLEQALAAN